MMENFRKIVLRKNDRRALRDATGVSPSTLSMSLSFQLNSSKGRRLRELAMNQYHGILIDLNGKN